ncbi:MAG: serine/threonine protein kinase [Nitrososphaerota archaeon]|nr:serine/threonine protein kinase [Nitrososphaerota archaeon]
MSQTASEQIQVSDFARTPYLQVLTYPKSNLSVARGRISQLERLGVTQVYFRGKTKIGRLGLVGIGTVSVVVRATVEGSERALKVRRCDANRRTMLDEYRLTTTANRIGVGPVVFGATKDFIVMQLVEGEEIDDHLRRIKGIGTRGRVREIIHRLLNQCRKLDLVGLDHGQLSDLRKHVIMAGDEPYIIDFESSSKGRSPKNVTTAAQSILIGGRSAPLARRLLGMKTYETTLEALRRYKRDQSDENYMAILDSIGVLV